MTLPALIRATYLDPATFPGEQSITLGSDIIVWQFDDTRSTHAVSRHDRGSGLVNFRERREEKCPP